MKRKANAQEFKTVVSLSKTVMSYQAGGKIINAWFLAHTLSSAGKHTL